MYNVILLTILEFPNHRDCLILIMKIETISYGHHSCLIFYKWNILIHCTWKLKKVFMKKKALGHGRNKRECVLSPVVNYYKWHATKVHQQYQPASLSIFCHCSMWEWARSMELCDSTVDNADGLMLKRWNFTGLYIWLNIFHCPTIWTSSVLKILEFCKLGMKKNNKRIVNVESFFLLRIKACTCIRHCENGVKDAHGTHCKHNY